VLLAIWRPFCIATWISNNSAGSKRSSIRITLETGKKPLRELRDPRGVSSTTAIHALREREEDNLVFQAEKIYSFRSFERSFIK